MVSKRLKRIRKRLREKNKKVVPPPGKASGYPQIVTTPTNDMMSALVDRSVYNTNYVSDRKPSRKKLRNMRSKMANEAENPNGGANASAAMMSRLGHLMSNGTQNDMLTQRIQAVQNTMDNKTLEITYKNQLAALQAQERNMVNEEKQEAMRKKYEDKIKKLEEEVRYRPQLEESRLKIQELELQLRHQEKSFQEEKQRRDFEQGMVNIQQQMEYNKREAEHQKQIYAANEKLKSKRAEVDQLKDANRRIETAYQLEQQTKAMNNDLLREAFAAQKNEITQAFSPIIEHLKHTNEQNQRDEELRQLINNQSHQIQALQRKIEYNTMKGANADVIDGLQDQVDEQQHNMALTALNRQYKKAVNRLDNEKAKLAIEEKTAEAMADIEDFCNPETARAEVDLNQAKHTKKLSVDLINTQRELNKELAVAKSHFDTLGMTEGLRDAVGLSGGEDITKSLTSDQCNGYILREKVKREENLRTLQGHNATLDSMIETYDKINTMAQSAQYKADQLSTTTLKPFLEETFGREYRDKIRKDKRNEIYQKLLNERQDEISASVQAHGTDAYNEKYQELARINYWMQPHESTMIDTFGKQLEEARTIAEATKRAEIEDELRTQAYAMVDKEVDAMPVPLLPEFLPQVRAYVNQQYKISKMNFEELEALVDKDAEIRRNNTDTAEFTRVLQQRLLNSGF